MTKGTTKKPHDIGPWTMIRDVLLSAMAKGQLPVLGAMFLFGLMVWKMPQEEVGKLVFRIEERLEQRQLLGYLISVIAICGWYVTARGQRRVIARELKRLSNERNALQAKAIGDKNVESSKS